MWLFKNKTLPIDDISKALFSITNNPVLLDTYISKLNKEDKLNDNSLRIELQILSIFIVDFFLHSNKVNRSYQNYTQDILFHYLKYFKIETEKKRISETFIDLLEERSKTYSSFIENDTASNPVHSPFKIAEELSKNCGADNQPSSILIVMDFFSVIFDSVSEILLEIKIVKK